MIQRWCLSAVLLLLSHAAWAQGAVEWLGQAIPSHLVMVADPGGRLMDAGGITTANGQPQNSTNVGVLPTGIGFVNAGLGICQWSGYANLPYSEFCWGFDGNGNGLIVLDRVGGGSLGLSISLNGVLYPFPGPGGGNVIGPLTSTVGELASFNNTGGTLLRQGAATLTDNITTGITVDYGSLSVYSATGISANQIYQATTSVTVTSYDVVRGVLNVPSGTTVTNEHAVGGFIRNNNPSGSGGTAGDGVTLFGAGISAANGAHTWGINTVLTDNTTYGVSGGTGRQLWNEFDFNVTSTATEVHGLRLVGASLVAPTAVSAAFEVGEIGSGIPWPSAFFTFDGAATNGLIIGQLHGGNSQPSQLILLNSNFGGVNTSALIQQLANGTTQMSSLAAAYRTKIRTAVDQDWITRPSQILTGGINLVATDDAESGAILPLEIQTTEMLFLGVNHFRIQGTTPAITSGFGTAPTIAGNNSIGRVTVGAGGASSGVVTFTSAWTQIPHCDAVDETTSVLLRSTPTTTTLTVTGAMTAADKVSWACFSF